MRLPFSFALCHSARMTDIRLRDRVSLAAKAVKGIFSEESLQETHGLLGGIFPSAGGDPPARSDSNVLNAYNTMPWLRAVSQRVATAVASSATDWRLYAPVSRRRRDVRKFQRCSDKAIRTKMIAKAVGGDLEPVEDHILLSALSGANSYMVGQALFKTTQIHLDLVGEAFWLKERNGLGAPVAFWPLPSNWVEGTPTPSSQSYRVSFRGWQGQIPESEILWMAEPDPTNPYGRGSGMGRALADELETDEYAAKHTRQLFFNRARPDLLVWPKSQGPHDPGLAQDQVRRLEERWLDGHQGFWRAFKPFFVGREIGVHEVSQNLRELQMVELRKQQRDMVVQMFGIPPELLGILTNSNRATIDAADFLFSRWVITPRLEFLRSQLQERLVPEYDDRLVIDYVSPIQEDREFMLEAAKGAPYAMTVDEWRTLQGQEQLPDGLGSTHLIPNNLVSARTPYVDPAPVPGSPAGTPERLSWREVRQLCDEVGDVETVATIEKLVRVDEGVPDLTLEINKQEPGLFRMLRLELDNLNARATTDDIEEVIQSSLTVSAVTEFVEMDEFFTSLEKSMMKPYLRAWKTGAELAADDIDVQLKADRPILPPGVVGGALDYFNEVNPLGLAWASTRGAELVAELSSVSKAAIQAIIDRSLRFGWGVRETAREIRTIIGLTRQQANAVSSYAFRLGGADITDAVWHTGINRYAEGLRTVRAKMIARTELSFASNEGQDALWQKAKDEGMLNTNKMKRRLMTGRVGVCPICERISQEPPVAFTAVFSNGLRTPPMHPNCRCRVALVKG